MELWVMLAVFGSQPLSSLTSVTELHIPELEIFVSYLCMKKRT